uniref:Uncharacterized protein n=1 Tax=Heliothis virescens TaxID=7102 RepID=A0A2A4JED4_HELVI
MGNGKPKRLSCILPEVDDEDITDTENIMDNNITQRILSDIRREVRDIIKEELQSTLQFYSDKIDEYELKINGFENKIKLFENQNMELKHKYKNLELKYEVVEQKLNAFEQSQLANNIDICGVAETEDVDGVVKNVCIKLNLKAEDVVCTYRKKSNRPEAKQGKLPPAIVVTLKEGCRDSWLQTIHLVIITEANISDWTKSLFELENYDMDTQLRENRKGGGVIVYVHKSICFTRLPSRTLNFESINGELKTDYGATVAR